MRNPNLSKRAIGCLGLTVVCVAIILLIFGAQTSLAHSPQHAERVTTSDDSAWSVRLHVKPAVRWIWLGAILMSLGALISMTDKRFRKAVPAP